VDDGGLLPGDPSLRLKDGYVRDDGLRQWGGSGATVNTEIKNNFKIKVKSSGQEYPLHIVIPVLEQLSSRRSTFRCFCRHSGSILKGPR
jgi:hypothetical protein